MTIDELIVVIALLIVAWPSIEIATKSDGWVRFGFSASAMLAVVLMWFWIAWSLLT